MGEPKKAPGYSRELALHTRLDLEAVIFGLRRELAKLRKLYNQRCAEVETLRAGR